MSKDIFSRYVEYIPSVPANWPTPNPAQNQEALDKVGSQVSSINTKLVYVDVTRGSDVDGTGSNLRPFAGIIAALAYCAGAGAGNYTLVLASGTYSGVTIAWPKNVNMVGTPGGTVVDHIIEFTGALADPPNCRFESFSIPGSKYVQISINTANSGVFAFVNCEIELRVSGGPASQPYISFTGGIIKELQTLAAVHVFGAHVTGNLYAFTGALSKMFLFDCVVDTSPVEVQGLGELYLLNTKVKGVTITGDTVGLNSGFVYADAASLSMMSLFGGSIVTAATVYLDDAQYEKYAPATPLDWITPPTKINGGLDSLAADLVHRNGSKAFTADQSLGGFKLTNVATPIAGTDAANKDYVDSAVGGSGAILANGSVPFTADESMGGFKLTDVANPTLAQDAATKDYVDTLDSGNIKADGSVDFTADQSMGGFKLTNVANPIAAQDAATKDYVDNAVVVGVAAPTISFVYQPGGTPGANVYDDWNDLYAAMASIEGLKSVLIDDSFVSPAVIPAGTYDVRNVTFSALDYNFVPAPRLSLDDGVVFQNFTRVTGGLLIESQSTSPVVVLTTGTHKVVIDDQSSIRGILAGVPFFDVSGTALLGMILSDLSSLGLKSINVVTTGQVQILLYNTSQIVTNALEGDGTVNAQHDGNSTISGLQASFTGTLNLDMLDNAENIAFSPSVPANWSVVPDKIDDALDELAARVSSGVTSDFVFQPGGTQADNVYTSWSDLMTAMSAVQGMKTLLMDGTFNASTCNIPVGASDLSNVMIYGMTNGGTDVVIDDGAIITGFFYLMANMNIVNNSTTDVCTVTVDKTRIYIGPLVVLRSTTTGRIWNLNNTGNTFFFIDNGAILATGGTVVEITAGSLATLYLSNNTFFQASVIEGAGDLTYQVNSTAAILAAQAGVLGAVTTNYNNSSALEAYSPATPADWLTPPTKVNAALDSLAADLIHQDGSKAFTADQSLGGFKLTNVANPVAAQDAATKDYVDTLDAGNIKADGSVDFTADQSMGGFKLTNVANPVAAQDAATKDYVDTLDAGNIKADGSVDFTADQSMGGFKLTNVANPVAAQDAATKDYVDTLDAGNIKADGSVDFTADQSMGGFKLTNVTNPVAAQDAATKDYVDTLDAGNIKADGSVDFTADQSMGGFKLTTVAAPTLGGDATNKTYVDAHNLPGKELFTLSGTDISNKFVALAHSVNHASVVVTVEGTGGLVDTISYDIAEVLGVTQIQWTGKSLDGLLVAGNNMQVQYVWG